MHTPIDVIKGQITDISPEGVLTIKAKYDNIDLLVKREYQNCNIQLIDGRQLSKSQRGMVYALLREISDYTGMGMESTKQWTKIKFLADDLGETADKIFSLSDAPMSLVAAFQRFLIRFIIEFEIPTTIPILEYVDDIEEYVYICAVNKKCCICGQYAEAHHWKRIGMGANRKTMNHMGLLIEPLCRKHHMECHNMAQEEFDNNWCIKPVKVDKSIASVFNLNTKGFEGEEELGYVE